MTHQDIRDAREALQRESAELLRQARARIEQDEAALRQECAAIGHVYSRISAPFYGIGGGRTCVVCGCAEAL